MSAWEQHIEEGLPILSRSVAYSAKRKVAVQAGGFRGLYPQTLSAAFSRVITWEPNPECWPYLAGLCGDSVDVRKAALWSNTGAVGMIRRVESNPGATKIRGFIFPGDEIFAPDSVWVPVESIDSVLVPRGIAGDVGLIQLDVEGGELDALYGAEQTITQSLPIIQVEAMGHGDDEGVAEFIQHFGYKREPGADPNESDVIWLPPLSQKTS